MSWFTQNAPQNPLPSSGSRTAPPTGTPNSTTPSVQPNQAVGQGVNGTQDYAAVIADLQKQFPPTPDGFKQLLQALNARGIPAMAASHANGTQASDDKIVLPNGTYYDIRNDNGWNAPGQALHWDPSVPVFNAQGQSQNYNDVLKSKGMPTFQFTPGPEDGPQFGGGQGGGTLQNPGGYATGSFMEPWNFKAPADVTEQNDPGFQFRLKEGLNAIQHSAAAKGTLLTGGTLKDLAEFGQNFASNEYEKVYGRALGEYQGSLGLKQNQFGNLLSLSNQGLNAAENANTSNSSYNNTSQDNITNQGDVNANRTIGGYGAFKNVPTLAADWLNTYLAGKDQTAIAKNPTANPSVQR